MKKIINSTSILILLSILVSCGGKGSYYNQFSSDKTFSSRISDLNKTIDEIRGQENGKLIKEDVDLLKYVYEIGENDTYIVAYLFDEKGCYEIGVDAYFGKETDANIVVAGIKTEMNNSTYGEAIEDNNLCRWKNDALSISVELDYKNTSRGLFLATIFANE